VWEKHAEKARCAAHRFPGVPVYEWQVLWYPEDMQNFLKGRLLFVRICLLLSAFALVLIGILTIYAVGNPLHVSLGSGAAVTDYAGFWKKQLVFAMLGCGCFVAVNLVHYRRLGQASVLIYAVVLMLLAYLLASRCVGHLPFAPAGRNNVYRWLAFHPRLPQLQPSEFCKLAYILALAWYLRYRSNYRHFRALLAPFALTLLPMMLILPEPNLGTVLLMMPIFFTMVFVAGARVKHLALIALLAVVVSPGLWSIMRPYQRQRIGGVVLQSQWIRAKAEASPTFARILLGEKFTERRWRNEWGYQLVRSKWAIASGGLTGYGFGRGPFIQYGFLDERHNDLIFCVIAHQWGFFGCMAFLGLYVMIIAAGLEIAAHNIDPFARLLAVGITAMFVVEVVVNVGMTLGLMPITGLTLPFVSYGGSSLLVNMTAVGLLNNVGRCRPFSVAPRK
jgi:rod shape determining protein RodA